MGEITTTDSSVNVAVTLVTPELAKEWLEWNIGNRRQRRSCINSYAKDMVSGNWSLTSQ